jgi:hypothetical protein
MVELEMEEEEEVVRAPDQEPYRVISVLTS